MRELLFPTSCRDSILADLHRSHEGANRSLSLARTCVYWPGMEADVMDYIRRCVTCIDNAKIPVETLHPHEVPAGPWIKIGMDFFQDDSGQKFLILADYFSKFPFIFPVASTHHQKMLRYLRDLFFDRHACQPSSWTDNGPPFNGEEFQRFAREFNFKHQTSSPHFHQSNGFIAGNGQESQSHVQENGRISERSKREPCYSYVTPQSRKIYHPRQKFCMDGPHKELSCPDDTDPSTSRKSTADL